ncbi:MAG: family 16 glycoside hydrolase [Gemmataceae bacterium]
MIRCEGKRIQLRINGMQTVDYTELDAKIEQTGLIGLQIHGGGPSEAWYKEIRPAPGRRK